MGENSLLGARFFLITPGTSYSGIKSIQVQGLAQSFRLHNRRMHRTAVRERPDTLTDAILIDVDDKLEAQSGSRLIPEGDHFLEFPAGINVQDRKWKGRRRKCFNSQMKKCGRILANRIKQYRVIEFRDYLTQDLNAFAFKIT
jgi:hypothetical protein